MSSSNPLENLVRTGSLKREPPGRTELEGLIRSGAHRLADAENEELSLESRFDLAYNAAHALSLAALRWHGYRSGNRYIVFQVLVHTLEMPAATWRLLAKCHQRRNMAEYEGVVDVEPRLLDGLIAATHEVLKAARRLPLPE